jgi:hypothetical protein
MIKEIQITEEMRQKADHKAFMLGELNNSILRGNGSHSGYLGEMIVVGVLGGKLANTFDYDLVLDDGTRVDVKTKRTSSPPLPYYSCSVAKFNTRQDCDAYAFVRVKYDLSVGWYLGYINKNDFYLKATEHKRGDHDPSNGFIFRADCYNLSIGELD